MHWLPDTWLACFSPAEPKAHRHDWPWDSAVAIDETLLLIWDVLESLKQVSLLQVPQEPPAMTAFSCSSWQGLVRALRKMQRCHSATDEAMGTENRPPTFVASLAVGRGEGLSALNATDLAPCRAPFVEEGREFNAEDMYDAFVRVEQAISCYKQLSH
ncbi:hypothetical protein MRX96_003666 [Rhipicephalus microplus]